MGWKRKRFLAAIRKQDFTVKKSEDKVQPARKGEYGMYLKGTWYRLTADMKYLKQR